MLTLPVAAIASNILQTVATANMEERQDVDTSEMLRQNISIALRNGALVELGWSTATTIAQNMLHNVADLDPGRAEALDTSSDVDALALLEGDHTFSPSETAAIVRGQVVNISRKMRIANRQAKILIDDNVS